MGLFSLNGDLMGILIPFSAVSAICPTCVPNRDLCVAFGLELEFVLSCVSACVSAQVVQRFASA
jgi:hypothetical protein